MLLKLALRNLARNRKRSLITITSIFLAVFFAVFMRSMQLGMYAKMIDNLVRFYSGYVQVHQNGYWDKQTLDNSMVDEDSLMFTVLETRNIGLAAKRLEGFTLASEKDLTKGVLLLGIEPKVEDELMGLSPKIISGELIASEDRSIMVGKGLAEYFSLELNDTMVFISQGYHGVSAAGKYPIKAILDFSVPLLNEQVAFLPLKESQYFFGAEGMISSIVGIVDKPAKLNKTRRELKSRLDTTRFEVMDWKEMMPDLLQTIQTDSAGGIIMIFILYVVISFGMFGTVLMLMKERTYEFGVILSIGMKRWKIWAIVFFESVIMSLTGAIAGIIGVQPLLLYFYHNPYQMTGQAAETVQKFGFEASLPSSLDPNIWINQGTIVVIISLIITLYPAWVISRIKPVEALKRT
jgi:ABC-type lipoprotein release transport system permease subunit